MDHNRKHNNYFMFFEPTMVGILKLVSDERTLSTAIENTKLKLYDYYQVGKELKNYELNRE